MTEALIEEIQDLKHLLLARRLELCYHLVGSQGMQGVKELGGKSQGAGRK